MKTFAPKEIPLKSKDKQWKSKKHRGTTHTTEPVNQPTSNHSLAAVDTTDKSSPEKSESHYRSPSEVDTEAGYIARFSLPAMPSSAASPRPPITEVYACSISCQVISL